VGVVVSIWKSKSRVLSKPWGCVELWDAPWGVHGKIIRLKADNRTSLKYYVRKREVLYCLSGTALVIAPDETEFGDSVTSDGSEFYLEAGDVLLIQPENPYRIKAFEDCILIEVTSGGHSSGDDCIMLDDDYGRVRVQKTTK
jgi:mannose-6-phosphate isomerase-like protein (cupin superfamily)